MGVGPEWASPTRGCGIPRYSGGADPTQRVGRPHVDTVSLHTLPRHMGPARPKVSLTVPELRVGQRQGLSQLG